MSEDAPHRLLYCGGCDEYVESAPAQRSEPTEGELVCSQCGLVLIAWRDVPDPIDPAHAERLSRRTLPLRWEFAVLPALPEQEDRAEFLQVRLLDDVGDLALLALPDAFTAMMRPDRPGQLFWTPGRYVEHVGLALVKPHADIREGEGFCFLIALDAVAWRTLAGRALPPVTHGPLTLTFPPLPKDFPWLWPGGELSPLDPE